jgi:formate dehydrogenase
LIHLRWTPCANCSAMRPARKICWLNEHLHKINDHLGHLPVTHLVALAHERRLAQTDVFEVASFYHHFDIAFESDKARTNLRLRVCFSW